MLNALPKITHKGTRRVGRGHGSGRAKTAGRGTKGQKARRTISLSFEGGALPLIKRLPFRRGKGRNKVFKKKPIVVNVKVLNLLPPNSDVTIDTLIQHKIVEQDAKVYGVKILGEGELSIPLKISIPASHGAISKIEKAGGSVVTQKGNLNKPGR